MNECIDQWWWRLPAMYYTNHQPPLCWQSLGKWWKMTTNQLFQRVKPLPGSDKRRWIKTGRKKCKTVKDKIEDTLQPCWKETSFSGVNHVYLYRYQIACKEKKSTWSVWLRVTFDINTEIIYNQDIQGCLRSQILGSKAMHCFIEGKRKHCICLLRSLGSSLVVAF